MIDTIAAIAALISYLIVAAIVGYALMRLTIWISGVDTRDREHYYGGVYFYRRRKWTE